MTDFSQNTTNGKEIKGGGVSPSITTLKYTSKQNILYHVSRDMSTHHFGEKHGKIHIPFHRRYRFFGQSIRQYSLRVLNMVTLLN